MKHFSKIFVLLAFSVVFAGCEFMQKSDTPKNPVVPVTQTENSAPAEVPAQPDPVVVPENNAGAESALAEGDNNTAEVSAVVDEDLVNPPVSDEPLDESFDPADSLPVEVEGGVEGVATNEVDGEDPANSVVVEITDPAPAPEPESNDEVLEPGV